MAKSLAVIQQQIQKLQEQADVLKRKEATGVIAKIKTAIEFYGLTPANLFGDGDVATAKRVSKTGKNAVSAESGKPSRKSAPTEKKPPTPPKYTDGTHFWSGHGKRPGWFKVAIDAGKSPEDLAVKPA